MVLNVPLKKFSACKQQLLRELQHIGLLKGLKRFSYCISGLDRQTDEKEVRELKPVQTVLWTGYKNKESHDGKTGY